MFSSRNCILRRAPVELASPLSYTYGGARPKVDRAACGVHLHMQGIEGREKIRSVEFQVPNMRVIHERMDFRYAYDTRYGG